MNKNDHLKVAETLARLLDSQFSIGKFKFGIDPLIGLVPWIGDVISFGLALYIYWVGKKLNIPASAQQQIVRNIVLDLLVGVVPIVGEFWDFAYRSNSKNINIIKQYINGRIEDAELVE